MSLLAAAEIGLKRPGASSTLAIRIEVLVGLYPGLGLSDAVL